MEFLPETTDSVQSQVECVGCTDTIQTEHAVETSPPCGHSYCGHCAYEIFSTALKSKDLKALECCGVKFTISDAQQHLPKPFVQKFKASKLGLQSTPETYCHVTTCSAFIPPKDIRKEKALCHRCGETTCSNCGAAWHSGSCFVGKNGLHLASALATGYQQCPECKTIVYKMEGCDHVKYNHMKRSEVVLPLLTLHKLLLRVSILLRLWCTRVRLLDRGLEEGPQGGSSLHIQNDGASGRFAFLPLLWWELSRVDRSLHRVCPDGVQEVSEEDGSELNISKSCRASEWLVGVAFDGQILSRLIDDL